MGNLSSPTPDATTASKGKVRLTNNLGGTANAPTVISQIAARQNDTTNTSVTTARIETGWGFIAYAAATSVAEAVSFGTAFSTAPIVVITFGGDSVAGTTYGSGANTVEAALVAKAESITTSGFSARLFKGTGGNLATPGNGFYQWIAIGS